MHLIAMVALLAAATPPEPPARRLSPEPVRISAPIAHISAAHELPDGRILITDPESPAIHLIDPRSGELSRVGTSGAGENQYVRPGGIYSGPGNTVLVVDRAQTRVLTISPAGAILGSSSIARQGWSGSSTRDVDLQRVDARGFTYLTERRHDGDSQAAVAGLARLLRLEPATQKLEPVTDLLLQEERRIPVGDNMVVSRTVIGSPADGWGVAPDGRVAVVRARPYRVEWFPPAGRMTGGPAIMYEPLPMTDADRKAHEASAGRTAAIGSTSGGSSRGPALKPQDLKREYAPTKPPFQPDDVIVSPAGLVWVMRVRPFGAVEVLYDVFDRAGKRVDRIELPAGSRVIGFGPRAVYVREADSRGTQTLKKYRYR